MIELNHIRKGTGEPLLLIHSLGGSIVIWAPVLDRLAAEREVIAVDMPGFGASSPLPVGVDATAANIAGAVIAFCDSLGIEADPGVSGISLGAWVAIECARQGCAAAVVGLNSAGFWKEPLGPRRNTARTAARVLSPIAPLVLRSPERRHRVLAGQMRHGERLSTAEAVAIVRGYGRAKSHDEANHLMRSGTVGDLSDVGAPLTLAWSEYDRVVRNRPLPADRVPDGVRQVMLPGCAHLPTWDDPELVTRTILEGTSLRRDDLEAISR